MQVQLADNAEFSYRIERSSRRRTVSIQIDAGEVVVRAPTSADTLWIDGWVQSKAQWIYPRLRRQQADLERHQIDLSSGQIQLFGEAYHLVHSPVRRAPSEAVDRELRLIYLSGRDSFSDPMKLEQRLKRLLREAGRSHLEQLTQQIAQRTGLIPSAVHVRNYKRKWGQCSSRKEITLNWRILHLPTTLQEYVIVHELCHLLQMNHSSAFWNLVEQHCPDYVQRRKQLKQYGACLMW